MVEIIMTTWKAGTNTMVGTIPQRIRDYKEISYGDTLICEIKEIIKKKNLKEYQENQEKEIKSLKEKLTEKKRFKVHKE